MALITVDNPEIYAVGVSHGLDMAAPAINAKLFPNNATVSAEVFAQPIPDLTVEIGGTEFVCAPQDVTRTIDQENGVDIEVQYYPKPLMKLRHGSLQKNLVFLSCRQYQIDMLMDKYDEELYEVLAKPCDPYTSNGWDLHSVCKEIGKRADVTFKFGIPTFHFSATTIMLSRGQTFMEFLRGLFPAQAPLVWHVDDDEITISLVVGSETPTISLHPDITAMSVTESLVPPFDYVEFEGADSKWTEVIGFGEATRTTASGGGSTLKTRTADPIVEGETTTLTSEKYYTGPDGDSVFAVVEKTTVVKGLYVDYNGEAGSIRTLKDTTETFTYENDDPLVYETPRRLSATSETSAFTTWLWGGQITGRQAYWLCDDGRILTPSEYQAIPIEDRPVFIVSAFQLYGAAERTEESWTWVTEDDADENYLEGMLLDNSLAIDKKFCLAKGRYYNADASPRDMLQAIVADVLTSDGAITPLSVASNIWGTFSRVTKTYTFLSQQSFTFSESARRLDTTSGNTVSADARGTIDGGQVPSSPTQYRMRPLKAILDLQDDDGNPLNQGSWILGGLAQNPICIPYKAEIPTANVEDFRAWCGVYLQYILSYPKHVSMQSFTRLFPVGAMVGNVRVQSYSLNTDAENGVSISMEGIA